MSISKVQAKWIKSLQLKKYRDEEHVFVAEGSKCVGYLEGHFHLRLLVEENDPLRASVSSLKTPQGPLAVFDQPKDHSTFNIQHSTLLLALDGVQDPGNLGTIIRTCDWFGVHDIFCSLDTADCFNPKVVQATMGSLSRVRLHYVNLPEWLNDQRPTTNANANTNAIFGTLLEGQNMYDVLSNSPKDGLTSNSASGLTAQRSIVVMGNEGKGLSAPVRQLITHPIRIPSYPENAETSESLNVSIATAIVLSEFRRLGL